MTTSLFDLVVAGRSEAIDACPTRSLRSFPAWSEQVPRRGELAPRVEARRLPDDLLHSRRQGLARHATRQRLDRSLSEHRPLPWKGSSIDDAILDGEIVRIELRTGHPTSRPCRTCSGRETTPDSSTSCSTCSTTAATTFGSRPGRAGSSLWRSSSASELQSASHSLQRPYFRPGRRGLRACLPASPGGNRRQARRQPATSERRQRNWVKVKCLKRQEFVIGGWTDADRQTRGLGSPAAWLLPRRL